MDPFDHRFLEVDTALLQDPEVLFDAPPPPVPVDDLPGLVGTLHRVCGQQPPVDCVRTFGRVEFLDLHQLQRQRLGQPRRGTMARPAQAHRAVFGGQRGMARWSALARPHVEPSVGGHGPDLGHCEQTLLPDQLAVAAGPRDQVEAQPR